jgi:hypothetical protein
MVDSQEFFIDLASSPSSSSERWWPRPPPADGLAHPEAYLLRWRSLGKRLLYLVSCHMQMDELRRRNESLWELFPGIETIADRIRECQTSATTTRRSIALNQEYCLHNQPHTIQEYPSTIWNHIRECQTCGKRWRSPPNVYHHWIPLEHRRTPTAASTPRAPRSVTHLSSFLEAMNMSQEQLMEMFCSYRQYGTPTPPDFTPLPGSPLAGTHLETHRASSPA